MDVALEQFKCACTSTQYRNGIKMLYIYLKNIHDQPMVDKYRKIRTGNEKFNSHVWCHETCRTILLLAGFEQVGEYIELSSNVDVTQLYNLLQKQLADIDSLTSASPATSTIGQRNATLSLGVSNQAGLFTTDVQADLTLLSYMVEMGYSKHASERGLVATKNQGVQPAMDWIASHPECQEPPVQSTAPSLQQSMPSATVTSPSSSSTPEDRPNVTSRLRSANEQKYAYQEKLRLEAIKRAKLDKAEGEMAKKYLKQNMQSERQENKAKFEREKILRHVEQATTTTTATLPMPDDNLATLRIRTHDGKVHTWETWKESSVKDLYSYVCGLVEMDVQDFHICIPHPHEVLNVRDDATLLDRGLYPKATVVIQKVKQEDLSAEEVTENIGGGEDTDDMVNDPVSLATQQPVGETVEETYKT